MKEVVRVPNIIWTLLIGLVAGWLSGYVMQGRGFGVIGNIIVGIIGAVIGSFLFAMLGVGAGSVLGEIVMATIGAVVLLFLISLVRRGTAAV